MCYTDHIVEVLYYFSYCSLTSFVKVCLLHLIILSLLFIGLGVKRVIYLLNIDSVR